MRKLKVFDLNLAEVVIRFYLMMAVVIVLGFLGQFTLAAILGYALGISFIVGASFRKTTKKAAATIEGQLRKVEQEKSVKKAA